MALSRLGNFIELVDIRNRDNEFSVYSLKGISINKVLTQTKANTNNLDLKSYKILKHNWFTYSLVTSRNGNKISLAHNDGEDCIVSSINPVFKVKDETKLLPRYLMMFFNRPEFDRYARFNSWGSARETFSWADFCDIELDIPPIEIQKKYVAIYEAMLANLRILQKSIVDLKTISYAVLEGLKQKRFEKLGHFIKESNEKNINCFDLQIVGISKEQKLIASDSRTNGVDKKKYFVLHAGDFAYSPIHINEGSIALNSTKKDFIVSPIYKAFRIIDKTKLYPPFLMLLFSRTEFIRYCWFNAFGSARDSFDWNDLCALEIPVPSFSTQKLIASFFEIYSLKKQKIENLQDIISKSCPILIRGSNLEMGKLEK